MRKLYTASVVALANLFFNHIQWAGADNTTRLALSDIESGADDRELRWKRNKRTVNFSETNAASLSLEDEDHPPLSHIAGGGASSYRLSAEVDGNKNVEDVWIEVRDYGSSSRSPYDSHLAVQDASDPNLYHVDILDVDAGSYTWRVKVQIATSGRRRRGHAYEYSPQYSFVVSEADTPGPTSEPTSNPTPVPSSRPTEAPVIPNSDPTAEPTSSPTTVQPSTSPTGKPSTSPTGKPSTSPTGKPSTSPTVAPSSSPSQSPTSTPESGSEGNRDVDVDFSSGVDGETAPDPTPEPTSEPTPDPTPGPTPDPTPQPTSKPTPVPTPVPTPDQTSDPTPVPSAEPTAGPTPVPTSEPTPDPTPVPTSEPTPDPTSGPTSGPTAEPTPDPTAEPTPDPTAEPTPVPTAKPTPKPTPSPTAPQNYGPLVIGFDGKTRLKACQGDCDYDSDCIGNLKCLQRGNAIVPGCESSYGDYPTYDFCYDPAFAPTPAPVAPTPPTQPTPGIKYGLQDDCNKVDTSKFNICLDLKSSSGQYESWMDAFALARDRWEQVITEDGGAARSISGSFPSKNIATQLPAKVDDIYVSGFVVPIDGSGGILGMAGPQVIRKIGGKYRPWGGIMKFDSADVGRFSDAMWESIIIHELGHVLGVGTIWWHNDLHDGEYSTDYYSGTNAQYEWEQICPGGKIPVETDGGAGTAGAHWDEKCLRGELMTGYVSPNAMQLSRLTIATLKDMGYGVDMSAADAYTRNDLGSCGSYCPNLRRKLRRKPLFDKRKERVSAEGHQQILAAAATELQRNRLETPSILSDDVLYTAADMVTVYIQDTDGLVKEETVSYDDVKDYIPQNNIFDNGESE